METRRSFLRKASILSGAAGMARVLPPSIQRALAIDPAPGSTFYDAEHIVFLMQENRSFDHTYGTLQGVRGFNDPRAIDLPNKNKVWLQQDEAGNTYCPFHLDLKESKATWMSSLPHGWADQVDARNAGKYDRWLQAKHSGNKEYASMPLTLGHYSRADIPFYFALADAFTVCDQNFCSSLTGTTPNRLHFWTGTIREKQEPGAMARVWNEDADYDTMVKWTTYPERLEEQGISWKVYQNEVSVGVGFKGEEDGWLANFGDNPLEYFEQYQVRLSPAYISNLPKEEEELKEQIGKLEKELTGSLDSKARQQAEKRLAYFRKRLDANRKDQLNCTAEAFDRLSEQQKNIHRKAFTTNTGDPHYHSLDSLSYDDDGISRSVEVPKGDILHQFRKDVEEGRLPTVSWIVAPENFSDHPSSAWYGAWYISEVMDILTRNPEVWKKTIFVLNYDENDGYFDHVPPFVPPHPDKPETGKTSPDIDTRLEMVEKDQQSNARYARESPIGLGYRVPLLIASPWSRGGWVCSEVFDHTSSLQFLENFLERKTGKSIMEPNISSWRRTVCGDLSSAFRPWNGEKMEFPDPIERDPFIETIHRAQFKELPRGYSVLNAETIRAINQNHRAGTPMPTQEKGTRKSCALPYELYADLSRPSNGEKLLIRMSAGKSLGPHSAGSPFLVYAPGSYQGDPCYNRSYAVSAGNGIEDEWTISGFENGTYHLRLYGPNGFYREFSGTANDPGISLKIGYERSSQSPGQFSGDLVIEASDTGAGVRMEISDNAYQGKGRTLQLDKEVTRIVWPSSEQQGWYDISIKLEGFPAFVARYAGRVETGNASITDPQIGSLA